MTDDLEQDDEAARIGKALKDYEPYADEPKINRIADLVDDLAAEIRTFGNNELIKKIEAIQTAIYRP